MAINDLKRPNNENDLKLFRGHSIPVQLHRQTISLKRQFASPSEKRNRMGMDGRTTLELEKFTETPCVVHYKSNYPYVITIDASTKGIGATLWQEQLDNGFA